MEKRELEKMAVARKKPDTHVVSFRVDKRVVDKLKKKGIDVNATARKLCLSGLERLAD